MATIRSETALVRQRIRDGEDLLRRYRVDHDQLTGQERELGAVLLGIADTGLVPEPAGTTGQHGARRRQLASRLHLTLGDLPPLMLLMAALAHRNGETVKELPAQHRILDGHAVEVGIVKRRHGPRRWFETVTWEIGPPGRELHYPGGMYLLLLELTARSRAWCGSPLAICLWRNGHTAGVAGTDEHYAPYAGHLKGATLRLAEWAASRPKPLLADPRPAHTPTPPPGADSPEAPAETPPAVLPLTFNRVKTSMDVRRTRQLGGHLPSAARSNTMQVLFRNYLSGDPVITDWADEVLGEAFTDAEQAALRAHQDALAAAGGAMRVVTGPVTTEALRGAGLDTVTAEQAITGDLDTAWTGCTDHDHHPVTGRQCQSTLLDCFHCGNCLITREHLPRLLALLDALNARRERMNEQDWWVRYGPAWAAIRSDILAKFSPAEREHAEQQKPQDGLLDLVENPWEQP